MFVENVGAQLLECTLPMPVGSQPGLHRTENCNPVCTVTVQSNHPQSERSTHGLLNSLSPVAFCTHSSVLVTAVTTHQLISSTAGHMTDE